MTDKKEKILNAALELFANDGYNATPTSKIAKAAGVSEGLIFRHFDNKKGLLKALNDDVETRLAEVLGPIIFEDSPKVVIQKYIALPFSMEESQHNYWKLQFKLKWEEEYYNPKKLQPIIDKLTWAFKELGITAPEKEALLLIQIMDSIATGILRDGMDSQQPFKDMLMKKYEV